MSRRLQPYRDEVPSCGIPRDVRALVDVLVPEVEGSFQCHLLSCFHLAPVLDMEMSRRGRKSDPSRTKKRRCLACFTLLGVRSASERESVA